jgi:hypothetical protein
MKKLIIIAVLLAVFFIAGISHAKDIALKVIRAECAEGKGVTITYTVRNYKNFDRRNVSVLFKIMEEESPAACKEVTMTVPKDADGTKEYETTIETACDGKPVKLRSTILHNVSRYKIEEWMKGCP